MDVATCSSIHWIQSCIFHLDLDLNTPLLFTVGLVQDTENVLKIPSFSTVWQFDLIKPAQESEK